MAPYAVVLLQDGDEPARQDSIAKFWALGTGSLIAGYWNSTAAGLIERKRMREREAAQMLALMKAAAMRVSRHL